MKPFLKQVFCYLLLKTRVLRGRENRNHYRCVTDIETNISYIDLTHSLNFTYWLNTRPGLYLFSHVVKSHFTQQIDKDKPFIPKHSSPFCSSKGKFCVAVALNIVLGGWTELMVFSFSVFFLF